MSRLIRILCDLHDSLTRLAAILAAIGLMLIVSFYVYEVVTRYLFDAPTTWVNDFVSYALCISVFLALPKVTHDRGHVAVTIVVDLLPGRIAGYLHTLISLLGFASLAFAAYVSFGENVRQYSKNIETLAIIAVPQWWISSFITFGLLMSAFHMLRLARPSHRQIDNSLVSATTDEQARIAES